MCIALHLYRHTQRLKERGIVYVCVLDVLDRIRRLSTIHDRSVPRFMLP